MKKTFPQLLICSTRIATQFLFTIWGTASQVEWGRLVGTEGL